MMAQQYETEQQVVLSEVSDKPKLHIMTAEDDSMAPGIIVTDDIYYEEGCIENGEIGVFYNIQTRQVVVRKGEWVGDKWLLTACNPDYSVINIDKENNEWYCFGRVTGCGRKVNKGDW